MPQPIAKRKKEWTVRLRGKPRNVWVPETHPRDILPPDLQTAILYSLTVATGSIAAALSTDSEDLARKLLEQAMDQCGGVLTQVFTAPVGLTQQMELSALNQAPKPPTSGHWTPQGEWGEVQ
jgi:hypothetical protein